LGYGGVKEMNVKEVKGVIFNNKLFLSVLAILIFSVSVLDASVCVKDGLWGDGHEFRCKQDNTYERCNFLGTNYEAVNICKYVCSASLACNDLPPNTAFESCNKYGQTYLQDFCNSQCQFVDLSNCESRFTGCTGDSACNNIQPGTNNCNNECKFQQCGDSVIQLNEKCELPNTNNNNYCSQSTETCLGNELGIRDSYGNCNNICGCIYDSFTYNCVKDKCGAQCDNDNDCQDYSCNEYYYDFCSNNKLVDYNDNNIKDYTYISSYADNYCYYNCQCSDYYAICLPPIPTTKCIKNVCNAQCSSNSDCNDNNVNTEDICLDDCTCQHNIITCVPNCSGRFCGPDGCGGSCGICYTGTCQNGQCISTCTPDCTGRFCGPDPICGYSCGTCFTGTCSNGQCCNPNCVGKFCGPDGCGGSCGTCVTGTCDKAGQCVCTPHCEGKFCGDNGCGGSCGTCVPGLTCYNGQCICIPKTCSDLGKQCGSWDNGCGNTINCGNCPLGQTCQNGQCINLAFCGNNVIDVGEQCELPNTNNNAYCSQTTTTCLGNKLGIRDLYGNCNNNCGCGYDDFSYSCVKNQCGAQCSNNADCNDGNANTADSCLNDCTCQHISIMFCGNGIIDLGEQCEFNSQCGSNSCQLTFSDYCNNKKLVEYNTNKILDSTTISNSCQNTCNSCACSNCQPQCNTPSTNEYCVKNICSAQCSNNSDCNDNNSLTVDSCNNCMCEHVTKICARDSIWGNNISSNEYYCASDRTYYRCNESGNNYDHINQCESAHCSASPFCVTKQPSSDLASCNKYGQTYLQDRCNADCQLVDDDCESRFNGCTGNSSCDDVIPGTGNCSLTCNYKKCFDGQTQACGQSNCSGIKTCYNDTWSECSTNNLDCGTCCLCLNGNETYSIQNNDCNQFNLSALSSCLFIPDANPFTLDSAQGFTSQCIALFSCSMSSYVINHSCSIENCGAQCEKNSDCAKTNCSNLNNCYGNIFRNYTDVNSTCNNCSCVNGICNVFVNKSTDNDHDGYNIECQNDCNDNNSAIHPNAIEICNRKDDNCNGLIDEGLPGIKKKITFHAKNMGKVNQLGNDTVFGYSKLYFDGWATKGLIFNNGKTSLELVSDNAKRTSFYLTSSLKKILENSCSTFKAETYGTATYWSKETGRIRIPITSVYIIDKLNKKVNIYGQANGFKYNITNVDIKTLIIG